VLIVDPRYKPEWDLPGDGELNAYRFAPLAQARAVVGVRLARRLDAAATARETGVTAYLQNGLAIGPV
jgi:hypothetical protein